jgi:hypothetical protein
MSGVVEFCFRPRCEYRYEDQPPYWFLDPFGDEALHPRLYCPACGKPRWLAVDVNEFVERFSFDFEPRGVYVYPRQDPVYFLTTFHSGLEDVQIEIRDKAHHLQALVWDLRMPGAGEKSIREMYGLALPDACTFSATTPCERMVCAVCGNQNWAQAQLTPVMTRPGDIVWVCRHGHFQGQNVDPYTGSVWHMTGAKMLEVLVWAPELVVPMLKHRWWGAPGIWGCDCAY